MFVFTLFYLVGKTAEEARGEKPNPNTALLSAILMFVLTLFYLVWKTAEDTRGEKPNPNTALLSAILMFDLTLFYLDKRRLRRHGVRILTPTWLVSPSSSCLV